MKKLIVNLFGVLLICSTLLFLYLKKDSGLLNNSPDPDEIKYDPEEKPELIISPEEQAINKRHQQRFLSLKTKLKSTSANSTMANGALRGTWNQHKFLTSDLYQGILGFRVDGSLYDKENDVIYAVSYAGHIYRIHRGETDADTDWELLNHHVNLKWKYYGGLNKADGSFRMIRSVSDGMEYSDNEGRDWTKVDNLTTVQSSSEGAIMHTPTGNKVFAMQMISSGNSQVYVTVDDGLTYTSLPTSFNPATYIVKMFKAYNSESVYMAAYNKATSKMSIYEHTVDGDGFELINTSNNTLIEPTNRSFIRATLHNGTCHIYYGCNKSVLYYSTNKGASWVYRELPEVYGMDVLREVHPTKPNMVFGGFQDLFHSADYGVNWEGNKHHIGWDVQHMNYYQRKDGSHFLLVGNDMGCYISDTPEVKDSYTQLNNGSPIQMCYDADHGQHTNTSFSALQDRGITGYNSDSRISESHTIGTTDGLRAELSSNETSVWSWLYYGSINRRENYIFGNAKAVGVGGKGNWWAAPMIAAPNPKEDAMILAYGNQLTKLSYNPADNKVIETQHHFDFNAISGAEISGFGYSKVNKNRWYVALDNRDFYYSVDGGQTFEKSTYTGTRPWSQNHWHKLQHVIKASKQDEQTVYWAGKGNTFLISKDGGKTFANHINGLDVARIIDFDVTPDDKFIFAACWGAGAWVYSADDDTWYPIVDNAIPSTGLNFTDAEFIDKKNEIRFGCYGSGILSFTIDGQTSSINYPDMLSAEIVEGNHAVLNWEDKSDNEEGFVIERAINGVFKELASVDANQTTYTDDEISVEGRYIYRIKAYNSTDESYFSNYGFIQVKLNNEVDKSGWTLVSVDSQADGYGAEQAFDGDASTIWHTQWGVTPMPDYPHTIVIDMNKSHTIKGFGYLPRQDNNPNGMFKGFEFYVSTDNTNWSKVSSGIWSSTFENKVERFAEPFTVRYLKLVGLNEVNGASIGSCAEISVYTEIADPTPPLAPVIIQAGHTGESEVSLTWLDMSKDEEGFVVEQYVDGAFTSVHTAAVDATDVTFSGLATDKTYWFRLYSYNSVGKSAYTDTITIASEDFPKNTGIYDLVREEDIKVFPNPFDSELNISYTMDDLFSNWLLVDMSGRVIKKGVIAPYQSELNISADEVNSGMYIINLSGKNGSISRTVIKNNQ